jgi:hypothetical protein
MMLAIPRDKIDLWLQPEHLQPAIDIADDGTTLEEVREQLLDGRSMLWTYVDEGEHVMSVVLTDENSYLYAWLLGGRSMDGWLDELIEAMRRYAFEKGYKGLKAVARPGLAKTLRAKRWKTIAEITRIEL